MRNLLPLILALLLTSCGTVYAAEAQTPAYKESPSETPYKLSCTCSCGCPYCGAEEPGEGVGRVVRETAAPVIRSDALDYTNGVIYGWDGRYCDLWEMELFAKIMYLEFWGCSPECCEAGVDSVLRLLESGYFGNSLGGLLSARCETGAYVYSPYAYVYDWEYDEQGLADMKALCMERFSTGPVWIAPFFQLYEYPSWAVPCYELDGVFFSTSPWME